jgi:hypothetical protein
MCIIAALPIDSPAARVESMLTVLRDEWQHNHDGAGFMYAAAGAVVVRKGFFSRGRFIRSLRRTIRLGANKGSAVVAHLRYATHGAKDAANSHPHRIGCDGVGAMVHNGVLPMFGTPGPKGVSDSADYARKVLAHLTTAEVIHPATLEWVRTNIGDRNKMVFMGIDGAARIVNETAGRWHDGVWYSDPTIGVPEPTPDPIGFGSYWNRDKVPAVFGPVLPSRLPDGRTFAQAADDADDAASDARANWWRGGDDELAAEWFARKAAEAADRAARRDRANALRRATKKSGAASVFGFAKKGKHK